MRRADARASSPVKTTANNRQAFLPPHPLHSANIVSYVGFVRTSNFVCSSRRADAYITIEGESDLYDAVLKGEPSIDNDGRIVNIEHSYYQLDGFKIDGMHSDDNYADKCLYVQQNRDNDNLAEEIEFNGHKFRCVSANPI